MTSSEDVDPSPIPITEPLDPTTAGEPPSPFTSVGPPEVVTVGELVQPVTFARASEPDWPLFEFASRRQVIWIALVAALLAVCGVGGILFVAGISGQAATHAAAPGQRLGTSGLARTRPTAPGHSANSSRPARPRPAGRPLARALVPASIAAFGPGGTGHGDSAQLARQALKGRRSAPWHSAWYATAHFGNLQNGTGLLLDMGREVTITSVRIALGPRPGTNLTLRIGNSPSLASLQPAAHADGAAGVVRLTIAPTRCRYVLVWFTKLPPDPAGTFQVSVSDINLRGYP